MVSPIGNTMVATPLRWTTRDLNAMDQIFR